MVCLSEFDAEPMTTTDDLNNFVNDVYFSELDLCRGYWQVLLSSNCKIYTAFAKHRFNAVESSVIWVEKQVRYIHKVNVQDFQRPI